MSVSRVKEFCNLRSLQSETSLSKLDAGKITYKIWQSSIRIVVWLFIIWTRSVSSYWVATCLNGSQCWPSGHLRQMKVSRISLNGPHRSFVCNDEDVCACAVHELTSSIKTTSHERGAQCATYQTSKWSQNNTPLCPGSETGSCGTLTRTLH